MRTVLVAGLLLGMAGFGQAAPSIDPVRLWDRLSDIGQDIAAIYQSFAGGPDDPHSPVTDQASLRQASAHLDAATAKANALRDELQQGRP
jgi:uncharacterized protein with von Willebrand factor type A (vWA) domain